jgi:hypothetical protein
MEFRYSCYGSHSNNNNAFVDLWFVQLALWYYNARSVPATPLTASRASVAYSASAFLKASKHIRPVVAVPSHFTIMSGSTEDAIALLKSTPYFHDASDSLLQELAGKSTSICL